jgi:hypothetical protein
MILLYSLIFLFSITFIGCLILFFHTSALLEIVFVSVKIDRSTNPHIVIKIDTFGKREVFNYRLKNLNDLEVVISNLIISKFAYSLNKSEINHLRNSIGDTRDFYLDLICSKKLNVKLTAIYQEGKSVCQKRKSQMRNFKSSPRVLT